ncbi:MAG: TetR/AcrR family transcriptional regulator [Acidobacteriota bacterium]
MADKAVGQHPNPGRGAARWGAPPRQKRSRRTLERILDAVQALIEDRDFDSLAVQEIARRAGCSVGGFYGRLRDKEALLHALDDRYVEQFATRIEATWTRAASEGAALPDLIRQTIATLLRFHREHRGLIRTLVLRARTKPDKQYRKREERLHALVPRFGQLLLRRRREIHHPDPALAVRFGAVMVLLTLRELVLWEHLARIVPISDTRLVNELTRAFLAYLGAPGD